MRAFLLEFQESILERHLVSLPNYFIVAFLSLNEASPSLDLACNNKLFRVKFCVLHNDTLYTANFKNHLKILDLREHILLNRW